MAHSEYKRIVPGADTAVLFIHGIVGSPDHFRLLIPLEQLVPENWSVYNILLPGHGGSVADFASSSMDVWRNYVRTAFEELAEQHEQVVIVAHSMGTLFALQLADEYPENVMFLFLLGVPLRPHLRPGMMIDSIRLALGTLPQNHVLWKAGSVSLTRKLWKYLTWIPRYLELFSEIRRTEKLLYDLNVPCVAWQSRLDELVSNASGRILEACGAVEVRNLTQSTHYTYAPAEKAAILDDFQNKIKIVSHD